MAEASTEATTTPFTGMVFTFTGFRDPGLCEKLQEMGASVKDTFSITKTSVLVKRDDSPVQAKETKAIEKGIPVWTRSDLVAKLLPLM